MFPGWERDIIKKLMRVISVKKLRDFWQKGYADSEQSLKSWYQIVKAEKWSGPADIKRSFPSASFIGNNRVIFNISGNKYRIIVHIHYNVGSVFIRFIGTHAQYDKIDVSKV